MIPLCVPEIRGNEWKYIKKCLDTNWVSSSGSFVNQFEFEFSKYLGSDNAVATMNGTTALELALRTLDIKRGDEVIVPSMTFISSVNVIKYVGAEPVFVDICRDTYVMDVKKIEQFITSKTKAIIPVHLYGHPVDMDKLMEVADKYNLKVIEDATESLGSVYKNKNTGTIGHIGCFSFNGNKLITTGAGGMVVTDSKKYSDRVRFLSQQTKVTTDNNAFDHPEIGYNYRMPNLLAAMGCAQLEKVDEYIKIKKKNAAYYNELLKNIKGVTLPIEKNGVKNIHWLYSIVIEEEFGISRDNVIKLLKKSGIESRPFFKPVHTMKPYRMYKTGYLKYTNELANKGLSLPSSVGIKKNEIEDICSKLLYIQMSNDIM